MSDANAVECLCDFCVIMRKMQQKKQQPRGAEAKPFKVRVVDYYNEKAEERRMTQSEMCWHDFLKKDCPHCTQPEAEIRDKREEIDWIVRVKCGISCSSNPRDYEPMPILERILATLTAQLADLERGLRKEK